ncbi:MAG: hypothetical protein ACP5LS_04505 [Thermoprotei archaeon]
MTKDIAGLALASLDSSVQLARTSLDNYNDLQRAFAEIKSRISFLEVQIRKIKSDTEKITVRELKEEANKNISLEEAIFKRAEKEIMALEPTVNRLRERSASVDSMIQQKPTTQKSKQEQTMLTMKLSLSILKALVACQRDYFYVLRRLAIIRFYVETLENLISGELPRDEAEKALRSKKP